MGAYTPFLQDSLPRASDQVPCYPKGPSTQYLGTWDLGNSNYSTGFGEVYDCQVLGLATWVLACLLLDGVTLLKPYTL